MQKKAFTLIELAIVLTIIGLLIGGSFKVMKMMREKAKTAEAKELVLGAKNAVFGYAMQNYYLPENSEFDDNLSTVKDPNHPLLYVVDYNLSQSDICAFTSTNLSLNNSGTTISDIAFVIVHEGANYNMQTASSSTQVNIYAPSASRDDNPTPVNLAEDYDDIVTWGTLKQLQEEIGCVDKPFRFATDKLPNAKVGVTYPSIVGTAKLEVENNISAATITCNPSSLYDINFTDPFFSGTPTTAGTAEFECMATVDDANTNNQKKEITKKFVITINPYLNRPEDANCTIDSECASGICVGGSCSSGVAGDTCDNSGDCQSGLCIGGICQAGVIDDNCTNNNQCQSGFCAAGKCTTGMLGANCDGVVGNTFNIKNSDCKSSVCYDVDQNGIGVCSGAIGDSCSDHPHCLTNYCDANNTCALMPSGSGSGTDSNESNDTGGGGGVTPPPITYYTISSMSENSYKINNDCKTASTSDVPSGTAIQIFKYNSCQDYWYAGSGNVNELDSSGNKIVDCSVTGTRNEKTNSLNINCH